MWYFEEMQQIKYAVSVPVMHKTAKKCLMRWQYGCAVISEKAELNYQPLFDMSYSFNFKEKKWPDRTTVKSTKRTFKILNTATIRRYQKRRRAGAAASGCLCSWVLLPVL
jgi:hypothetical protein